MSVKRIAEQKLNWKCNVVMVFSIGLQMLVELHLHVPTWKVFDLEPKDDCMRPHLVGTN